MEDTDVEQTTYNYVYGLSIKDNKGIGETRLEIVKTAGNDN